MQRDGGRRRRNEHLGKKNRTSGIPEAKQLCTILWPRNFTVGCNQCYKPDLRDLTYFTAVESSGKLINTLRSFFLFLWSIKTVHISVTRPDGILPWDFRLSGTARVKD
ncbi:hypothetical protein PoB_002999400 [Plakobranchus ocellatus]|uniref:Uncharacterized protein n=1 Tax=Plakobranchus ocellatus TaxID=259542 RepID=A0AAV4AAK4_9GAST|nr:hypothetical protein PoB_002999400 [Plakobranchus ocellatus]